MKEPAYFSRRARRIAWGRSSVCTSDRADLRMSGGAGAGGAGVCRMVEAMALKASWTLRW